VMLVVSAEVQSCASAAMTVHAGVCARRAALLQRMLCCVEPGRYQAVLGSACVTAAGGAATLLLLLLRPGTATSLA
jgi:hypothetical protein